MRLLTVKHDRLTRAKSVTVIEEAAPELIEARRLMDAFRTLVRRKGRSPSTTACAGDSLISPFARGIAKDHVPVRAAIAKAWSNAQGRASNHQAKAPEPPDVRTRENRPA